MKAVSTATPQTFSHPLLRQQRLTSLPPKFSFQYPLPHFISSPAPGLELFEHSKNSSWNAIRAVDSGGSGYVSPWDEKPYQYLPGGERSYIDEQDIVTFLDPPLSLIPLDPASYNPAAYIWKKIEDIPEERRHRLLDLLKPRLISRAWEIAGTRYEDPKLAKRSVYDLLPDGDGGMSLEFYNCRTSEGPTLISWINYFKTAMFSCSDGNIYGRFIGGSFLEGLASKVSPLYFVLRNLKEVMSTEQPCDFAYEFGNGLFDLPEYPQGFPMPVKHPYPFNDQVVVYVRHLGPGVAIAQAWQEGKALEQVPQKLCSEILMVKEYASG